MGTHKESQSKWIMMCLCLQGSLLMALTTLVTNSRAQPNYILCFPATAAYDTAPSRRPSGSNSPTNDSPTGDNAAGNLAFTLHQQHMRAGMIHALYFTYSFMNISRTEILFINTIVGGERELSILWFSWRKNKKIEEKKEIDQILIINK
jgi:hypothetical protein